MRESGDETRVRGGEQERGWKVRAIGGRGRKGKLPKLEMMLIRNGRPFQATSRRGRCIDSQ